MTNATTQLVNEINRLLADQFALFVKTKNFHWHVRGSNFRDLHLMFDEHAAEIYEQIDGIAERARKLGGETITSIAMIAEQARIADQNSASLSAAEMVAELRDDNVKMVSNLKAMKDIADAAGDSVTDGMIDDLTDMAEQRAWFLSATLD